MFVYASDRWDHAYDGGTKHEECSTPRCSCHPAHARCPGPDKIEDEPGTPGAGEPAR